MVTLGKFQHNLLIHNSVVPQQQHLLQFPSKTHLSFPTRLDFHAAVGKSQNGFCCSAAKTKKKKGGSSTAVEIDVADEIDIEIDGAGEFEDDFDDEFSDFEDDGEFDGGEDEEDDGEEVFVPLENMKKWLASRPSGFGEGKTYDTSVEDKLVEELEQSRKAQLANLNKLKHGSVNPNPKKVTANQDKGSAQDGFRVRLVNLPKKKNIHRDLQLAFKGTPGLLSIVPVVAGNEKTRDPVCKGIAFVDFKYQDEAQRFVENYSGRSISYGKVQKQLTCEMVNPSAPKKSAIAKSVDVGNRTPRKPLLKLSEELDDVLETDVPLLRSLEETVPNELDGEWEDDDDNDDDDDDEEINATSAFDSAVIPSSSKKISKIEKKEKKAASKTKKEGVPKIKKINATSAFDGSNTVAEEIDGDSVVSSSSSKQTSKIDKSEKKAAASKTKKNKNIPKTKNILGSATRLKVRDKAVLTGVLSKYGAKATLAVKEQAR